MNRTELTLLLAATFVLAVLLGWTLRWVFSRLNRVGLGHGTETNDLAAALHAAEEARDAAYAERDAALNEMQNKLRETEAELSAAMEGLGHARREAEDLRARLSDPG